MVAVSRQRPLLTLSRPRLPRRHSEIDLQECQIWNHYGFYCPFAWARERTSIKMHSIESRFVILGSSHILFDGVYVCTFQLGNFTGWGSEGVNIASQTCRRTTWRIIMSSVTSVCSITTVGYQCSSDLISETVAETRHLFWVCSCNLSITMDPENGYRI